MLVRTSSLTASERLLIERRRLGETQVEAAERCGLSTYRYRALEEGDADDAWRGPKVGRLAEHECCLILRRRAGLSRSDAADELGVSEWWYTQMERGEVNPGRLVEFWEQA